MKITDFEIGAAFYYGEDKWLCTDVGSRVVVCVPWYIIDEGYSSRPPFPVAESLFSEFELPLCTQTPRSYQELNVGHPSAKEGHSTEGVKCDEEALQRLLEAGYIDLGQYRRFKEEAHHMTDGYETT